MLSTMQLGQEYSTENFTPTHQAMLDDLKDYGLVYQRKVRRYTSSSEPKLTLHSKPHYAFTPLDWLQR